MKRKTKVWITLAVILVAAAVFYYAVRWKKDITLAVIAGAVWFGAALAMFGLKHCPYCNEYGLMFFRPNRFLDNEQYCSRCGRKIEDWCKTEEE